MTIELSTAPNVGPSIKSKQIRLYTICHDYLIDNFHKFTDANKLKVALVISGKMVPTTVESEGGIGETKIVIIHADKTTPENDFKFIRPGVELGNKTEAVSG